jgi:nucleotide sugar dehydrogenase
MGISPTEDVTSESISAALNSGAYRIRSSYEGAPSFDYAVIAVPTPLNNGAPDMTFIELAGKSIAGLITRGCTVILESTTYPGTTEEVLLPILEQGSGLTAGVDFFLGYSPERIDPGNKQWTLINTPKIVSGNNPASLNHVSNFYQALGIQVIPVTGTREAEMTKLLENTFRHVNIALVNELAVFSHALGVDMREAIEAASTKPFGFMKFSPGPGVGGHCLPIDPSYLSWAVKEKTGQLFKFVELANQVNSTMPRYVFDRLESLLDSNGEKVATSRILLLGLAYKEDTGDVRESPAIILSEFLAESGAKIFAIDDLVPETLWPQHILRHSSTATTEYSAAVLLTNHTRATLPNLEQIPVILDTRNVLRGANVIQL